MQAVRVLSTLALKGAVMRLAGQYEAAAGVRIEADFARRLDYCRGCVAARAPIS